EVFPRHAIHELAVVHGRHDRDGLVDQVQLAEGGVLQLGEALALPESTPLLSHGYGPEYEKIDARKVVERNGLTQLEGATDAGRLRERGLRKSAWIDPYETAAQPRRRHEERFSVLQDQPPNGSLWSV